MARKGHFDGKRAAGTHTTVIPEAEKVVKRLTSKDCPCQSLKVSPGQIKKASTGRMSIKVKNHQVGDKIVGLVVTVRGVNFVQELRILNTNRYRQVKKFLEREFA